MTKMTHEDEHSLPLCDNRCGELNACCCQKSLCNFPALRFLLSSHCSPSTLLLPARSFSASRSAERRGDTDASATACTTE